jgi:hypothetical protein
MYSYKARTLDYSIENSTICVVVSARNKLQVPNIHSLCSTDGTLPPLRNTQERIPHSQTRERNNKFDRSIHDSTAKRGFASVAESCAGAAGFSIQETHRSTFPAL